eukprot:32415-Eustigmatos_ZCMA.PRE.1
MPQVWSKPVLSITEVNTILGAWSNLRGAVDTRGYNRVDVKVAHSFEARYIPDRLRGIIMSHANTILPPHIKHISLAYHLMDVLPGASIQDWHQDSGSSGFYATYAIALTRDTPAHGYTEFRHWADIKCMPPGHMTAWMGNE